VIRMPRVREGDASALGDIEIWKKPLPPAIPQSLSSTTATKGCVAVVYWKTLDSAGLCRARSLAHKDLEKTTDASPEPYPAWRSSCSARQPPLIERHIHEVWRQLTCTTCIRRKLTGIRASRQRRSTSLGKASTRTPAQAPEPRHRLVERVPVAVDELVTLTRSR